MHQLTDASDTPVVDRGRNLGQFFTPDFVADFMVSLFESCRQHWNVLDAGAGQGALSAALVKYLCASRHKPQSISITACEIDGAVIESLHATLEECGRKCKDAGIRFSTVIKNEDFIAYAVPLVRGDLFTPRQPHFNAAIVNPPYRKIRSHSNERLLFRSAGIETGNLYAGFVALITKLLGGQGELVAITPRSFCNGPYFKPFRMGFLETMSLRQLHVFESRSSAFGHDGVLQENILIHAVKNPAIPRNIIISSSSGADRGAIVRRRVDYGDVVSPDDPERFIHLVENEAQDGARMIMSALTTSLSGLGLSVSTGRVVDFRANAFLRRQPEHGTAPLIYPCHFNGGSVHWPNKKSRKPNAIICNEQTRGLLVPAETYVLVKRFTAKEERRRIVACIYDSRQIEASLVGFENHLNYFHIDGHGLPMDLAKGLAAFLNSTVVDVYFRQFNGHTQVNATDLRSLRFPSKTKLERLGRMIDHSGLSQTEIDGLVKKWLFL
jgi:adenine-specific DNA-methyltransferase